MSERHPQLLNLTRNIVCSFVANNFIACDSVTDLIEGVYESLSGVSGAGTDTITPKQQKSAVPIALSITPDYLVCLEDGRTFKSLRRHLCVKYRLTPEQYRVKWGLPADYPMIVPNYAAERSRIAKEVRSGGSFGSRDGI
ncbi:MucR family transcriptional regulator [Rhizobium lusitanum]|uniref:MucR family transcriptional regulator n=1 Tax=Rhizobium lusitanum TaxID=293958 RepID=UPI001956406D|nr:MucR family transcriptional regulator [Rhizobium lusitanum]MBM7046181.1 MucR family transcriptional regulator [Rhizobium lusitanum]